MDGLGSIFRISVSQHSTVMANLQVFVFEGLGSFSLLSLPEAPRIKQVIGALGWVYIPSASFQAFSCIVCFRKTVFFDGVPACLVTYTCVSLKVTEQYRGFSSPNSDLEHSFFVQLVSGWDLLCTRVLCENCGALAKNFVFSRIFSFSEEVLVGFLNGPVSEWLCKFWNKCIGARPRAP